VASWTTPVLGAVEGWAGTQTFGALAVGEDGFVAAVNGEEPGSFWIVSIGDRGLVRWSASDRDLEVDLPLRLTGAEATTHGYLGFLAAPVGAAGVAALRLDVDGRRLCAGPIEELDLELSGVDPLRTMTAGVVAIGVTAAQPRQPWIGRLVE
jgi:hypothetical protein